MIRSCSFCHEAWRMTTTCHPCTQGWMDKMRCARQYSPPVFLKPLAHPYPVPVILGRIQFQRGIDFLLVCSQRTRTAVISLRHLDQHPCIAFKYFKDAPGRSSFLLGYLCMIPILPFEQQIGHQCQPQDKEQPFDPNGLLQIDGTDPQLPLENMIAALDIMLLLEEPKHPVRRVLLRRQRRHQSIHPIPLGRCLHLRLIDFHPELLGMFSEPQQSHFVPLPLWILLQSLPDVVINPPLGPAGLPYARLQLLQPLLNPRPMPLAHFLYSFDLPFTLDHNQPYGIHTMLVVHLIRDLKCAIAISLVRI